MLIDCKVLCVSQQSAAATRQCVRTARPDLAVLIDCKVLCVLLYHSSQQQQLDCVFGLPDLAVLIDCTVLCVSQQSATATRQCVWTARPDLAVLIDCKVVCVLLYHSCQQQPLDSVYGLPELTLLC